MEQISKEQIENIFKEIDKDNDGLITQQDLESTAYLDALFESHPIVAQVHFYQNSHSWHYLIKK